MQINITQTAKTDLEALSPEVRKKIQRALDTDDERAKDAGIQLDSIGQAVKVLRMPTEELAVLYKEEGQERTVVLLVPLSGLADRNNSATWPVDLTPQAPQSTKVGHEVLSKIWTDNS